MAVTRSSERLRAGAVIALCAMLFTLLSHPMTGSAAADAASPASGEPCLMPYGDLDTDFDEDGKAIGTGEAYTSVPGRRHSPYTANTCPITLQPFSPNHARAPPAH